MGGEDGRIDVRLQPRSSADELLGLREGVLRARVSAPPVDGKANRALCRLIAKRVGVPLSAVSVVHGEKSRNKIVRVRGFDGAALRQALSNDREKG